MIKLKIYFAFILLTYSPEANLYALTCVYKEENPTMNSFAKQLLREIPDIIETQRHTYKRCVLEYHTGVRQEALIYHFSLESVEGLPYVNINFQIALEDINEITRFFAEDHFNFFKLYEITLEIDGPYL